MIIQTPDDLITSRLGFGCGRLKGGGEKNNSLRLVHTALDVGIRYFDTAPPYGLGASEGVLGEALKGRQENVIVATKVGLPRPASPGLMQLARAIVKPLAGRIPLLQKAVLKGVTQRTQHANFSIPFVEQSFETSLRLLCRERIDYLLLHEALFDDQIEPLQVIFETYVAKGQLGAYGSSTGESIEQLIRFGSISQYRCPDPVLVKCPTSNSDVLHGALRYIETSVSQQMLINPKIKELLMGLLPVSVAPGEASGALALAYVMAYFENRLLFSTNCPKRLVNTVGQLRYILENPNWRPVMKVLFRELESCL